MSYEKPNSFKSSGSRDIFEMSTSFIKQKFWVVTTLLTFLIICCMAEGVFPGVLKTARTVPIYKKGPKGEVSCYRPV